MPTGEILEHRRASQWVDKGTYKEPKDTDNVRVPRLEVDDATTYVDKDGSNNMTLTDAVTGTKTLAQLSAAGTGDVTGPSSSTDNMIARHSGTGGKTLQDYTSNPPTISDTGDMNIDGDVDCDNVTVSGNVDGRDVSVDGTKLDGIAAGANNYTHPNHSGEVTSVADGAQTIANDAVTYAKMQNVSATDKVLGRATAGAGDVEEIACTAAGRALLDDADAAAQKTTLSLDNVENTAHSTDAHTMTIDGVDVSAHAVLNATDSAIGHAEFAIASEINTGTDATRANTPDALAGSNFGIRYLQAVCFDFTTDCAVGNGKMYWHIPPALTGMNLVYCHAEVITAGTTGTMDIQIHNLTDTADMLSTVITIDTGETGSDTAATPYVINGATDDVATNDVIRVDVDVIHTTAAKGLIITLGFQLP